MYYLFNRNTAGKDRKMDKKLEFNEALSALIEFATVNGNQVSCENVHTYFNGILDNEDMYTAVYKYLLDSKIKIVDLDDATAKSLATLTTDNSSKNDADSSSHCHHHDDSSDEEKMFLELYMKDIDSIPVPTPEEKAILIEKACMGDRTAFTNLVEVSLPIVLNVAERYLGQGVRKADLIQDGNLGLIEAIMNYDHKTDFDQFVVKFIENAMQDAIDEERGMHRIAEHAAERANAISDATTALAEKLGREATIEELCEYMSLSEDEIREAIKISLDAMTIN